MILTLLIQTLYCLLGQEEEGICSVIRVPLFRASVCYDKLHRPKLLGDFNIAKNPSIINKSFCSGTDAG